MVAMQTNPVREQSHNRRPMEIIEDGSTCQIWQVKNARRVAGFSAPPDRRERVFFQNCPVGKQKQPVAAFQLGTGIKERFHPRGNRGDGQNAETMDAKTPLVNLLRPGRFVCDEFAVKGGLG